MENALCLRLQNSCFLSKKPCIRLGLSVHCLFTADAGVRRKKFQRSITRVTPLLPTSKILLEWIMVDGVALYLSVKKRKVSGFSRETIVTFLTIIITRACWDFNKTINYENVPSYFTFSKHMIVYYLLIHLIISYDKNN